MIPYSQIGSVIKPYHLFCYTEGDRKNEIKKIFLTYFEDGYALIFLRYLIKYCDEKNNGERWPDKITPEIVSWISKKSNLKISVEEMKIFKDGFLINETNGNYELTHEFIVASFMCCSEGIYLPLSQNHIDFDNRKNFIAFLKYKINAVERNLQKADPCVMYVQQHKLNVVDGIDIITCSELMLVAYYMIPRLSEKNQRAT